MDTKRSADDPRAETDSDKRPERCSNRNARMGRRHLTTRGSRPSQFRTRGYFTEKEKALHINALELLGYCYTIRSLLPSAVHKSHWPRTHINCELNNTTAIKYARVAVSRSLRMSRIGAMFYDWVEGTGLQLSYRHLCGIYNVEADS